MNINKSFHDSFRATRPTLVHFINKATYTRAGYITPRGTRARALGVVVAYKDDMNTIRVGWSKWNPHDIKDGVRFDKYLGFYLATRQTFHPFGTSGIITIPSSVPHELRRAVEGICFKAKKYFKTSDSNLKLDVQYN